jgi:hypothetical protein
MRSRLFEHHMERGRLCDNENGIMVIILGSGRKTHDKVKRGGMVKHSGRRLSQTQFCLDNRRTS